MSADVQLLLRIVVLNTFYQLGLMLNSTSLVLKSRKCPFLFSHFNISHVYRFEQLCYDHIELDVCHLFVYHIVFQNLPFGINNRYKLTALFIVFFGSGLSAPFVLVRHQLLKD